MIRPVALLLVVAIAAAGCSGDEPSAAPSTTVDGTSSDAGTTVASSTASAPSTSPTTTAATDPTAPPTTSATTTSAPPTSTPATTAAPPTTTPDERPLTDAELADRELARTALLTLADFPDGWVEDPVDDDTDSGVDTAAFEAEFDACLGRDTDEQLGDSLERLSVETGDFHPDGVDTTDVSHEVAMASSEAEAIDRMSEVEITGSESCVADVVVRFYETAVVDQPALAGIEVGDVIVTRTEADQPADAIVGTLVEVPLTIDGQTVSQFLEFVFQRHGRALSELSFSAFGEPFDRDGYAILSDEVAGRLATIGG